MTIQTYKLGPGTLKFNTARQATIAVTTGSTTITATTNTFISGDVGAAITGIGIPVAATIAAVISPTQATLSAAATATNAAATATITPTGTVQDFSCQMKGGTATCEEEVEEDEAVDVLCGEQLAADEDVTHTWKLAGEMVQDVRLTGLNAWTWSNKGRVVWFEYVPNSVLATKVSGPLRVIPLPIGGDEVKKRPTNPLEWNCPKGFDFKLS